MFEIFWNIFVKKAIASTLNLNISGVLKATEKLLESESVTHTVTVIIIAQ